MPNTQLRKPIGIKQVDFGLNDGKLDSVERYFLDTGLIDKLKNRKSFFVLGRKGTGKTAVARQLTDAGVGEWNEFSSMLSLRDVPVKLLEAFEDQDQIQSGRFVLVWQFILLVELAKQVIKDVTVAPEASAKLETIILATAPDLSSLPDVYLKQTRERGYKVHIGKDGLMDAGLEEKRTSDGTLVNLIDYTEALKRLLLNTAVIGKSYRIIIDELDDSYSESKAYFDILIALFKAAVAINSASSQQRKHCTVIVALRDDIFESINYGDKNKWSDMAVRISWLLQPGDKPYKSNLFNMINLRIGASLVDEPMLTEEYWGAVFASEAVRGDVPPFPYILSRTLYRPRDVIQFCKCIQEACPESAKTARAKDILAAEMNYSDWLLAEIVDEIHVKLPQIREVFEAFRQLRQSSFTARDITSYLRKMGITDTNAANNVLSTLYNFSVIGQFDGGARAPIFRYRNPLRKFEPGGKYSVHYGLRSTLRLY
jgi:hypothetical protein